NIRPSLAYRCRNRGFTLCDFSGQGGCDSDRGRTPCGYRAGCETEHQFCDLRSGGLRYMAHRTLGENRNTRSLINITILLGLVVGLIRWFSPRACVARANTMPTAN